MNKGDWEEFKIKVHNEIIKIRIEDNLREQELEQKFKGWLRMIHQTMRLIIPIKRNHVIQK